MESKNVIVSYLTSCILGNLTEGYEISPNLFRVLDVQAANWDCRSLRSFGV
jgi:hypothetical protein